MTKKSKLKRNENRHSNRINDDHFALSDVTPKNIGVLDMVIAFDTTGSMASYIGAVRKEVTDLIPRLFKYSEFYYLLYYQSAKTC